MDFSKLGDNIEFFLELVPKKHHSPSFSAEKIDNMSKQVGKGQKPFDYNSIEEAFKKIYGNNIGVPLNILVAGYILTSLPNWKFTKEPNDLDHIFYAGNLNLESRKVDFWFQNNPTNIGSIQVNEGKNWRALVPYVILRDKIDVSDMTEYF